MLISPSAHQSIHVFYVLSHLTLSSLPPSPTSLSFSSLYYTTLTILSFLFIIISLAPCSRRWVCLFILLLSYTVLPSYFHCHWLHYYFLVTHLFILHLSQNKNIANIVTNTSKKQCILIRIKLIYFYFINYLLICTVFFNLSNFNLVIFIYIISNVIIICYFYHSLFIWWLLYP